MASNLCPNKTPLLAVRGSDGLTLYEAQQPDYSQLAKFNNYHDASKNCRTMCFSTNGKLFAYCNNSEVKVIDVENFKEVATFNKPKTSYISFSPQSTYLVLWELFYAKATESDDSHNLNLFDIKSGQLIKSFLQKKQLEQFIQWSNGEQIFAILTNNGLRFFDTSNPLNHVQNVQMENLVSFCMNSNSKFFTLHVSGKKNQPSFIRLYEYPNVTTPISNKSFFSADNVEVKWNKAGTNLLLLCSTETSANSYYGDTSLYYMNASGETFSVTLSKKGPVYSLEWNPNKDEFIVVYGTTPAKATLFNSKCEIIFDFGTGARNQCFFSPLGNIVCLCGFGNIRGRIEVWNLGSATKAPESICSFAADDTTFFEWSPDGEHIITATTAPRLRVSNGFKIWNYIGENKYSYLTPQNTELWQVLWQPGVFKSHASTKALKKPVVAHEEVTAYVPPHLRGKNQTSNVKLKLHEDEKPDTSLKIKREEDPAVALEKKIKGIKKKLQQIDELKKKQASGTKLEANQIEKLQNEESLLQELENLGIKN